MTGLFTRLAAQVVGPPPARMRSAAALPFAAPSLAESPGPAEPVAPAEPATNATPLPAPLVAPTTKRIPPIATATTPETPAQPVRRRVPVSTDPARRQASPDVPAATISAIQAATETTEAGTPPPASTRATTHLPPPLLPPSQPPAAEPHQSAPAIGPPQRPALREAPPPPATPEVHIHIGRVEVTSVAAPPAVARAPRARPPMSLAQ